VIRPDNVSDISQRCIAEIASDRKPILAAGQLVAMVTVTSQQAHQHSGQDDAGTHASSTVVTRFTTKVHT